MGRHNKNRRMRTRAAFARRLPFADEDYMELKRILGILRDLFLPQPRNACPHCGGIRCIGACQFNEKQPVAAEDKAAPAVAPSEAPASVTPFSPPAASHLAPSLASSMPSDRSPSSAAAAPPAKTFDAPTEPPAAPAGQAASLPAEQAKTGQK